MRKKKNKGLVYQFEKGFEDPIKKVTDLPRYGQWLPISVSAILVGLTPQMVRYLMKNEVVEAIQFKKGPVLINHKDVLKNWVNI